MDMTLTQEYFGNRVETTENGEDYKHVKEENRVSYFYVRVLAIRTGVAHCSLTG